MWARKPPSLQAITFLLPWRPLPCSLSAGSLPWRLPMLGFDLLAGMMRDFLTFAGHVLLGLVVFGFGLYLAKLVADMVRDSGIANAQLLATIARPEFLSPFHPPVDLPPPRDAKRLHCGPTVPQPPAGLLLPNIFAAPRERPDANVPEIARLLPSLASSITQLSTEPNPTAQIYPPLNNIKPAAAQSARCAPIRV